MKTIAFGVIAFFTGASQAPNVSIDLTPILVTLITVIGVLGGAGLLVSRTQKRKQIAETRKADADADLAGAQVGLTHVQYEGFIAEAAERLSHISEAAIARLEAQLAHASQRIAELETELERVKSERDRNIAARVMRERELQTEIGELRDQVVDLERRLEANGVRLRRHNDRSVPPPVAPPEEQRE